MEGASPPVFEQIFRNARFAQGGNALFEGKVAGSPKPQVGKNFLRVDYYTVYYLILPIFSFYSSRKLMLESLIYLF